MSDLEKLVMGLYVARQAAKEAKLRRKQHLQGWCRMEEQGDAKKWKDTMNILNESDRHFAIRRGVLLRAVLREGKRLAEQGGAL